MDLIDIVRQTITVFCMDFISNPYMCYTEHGQHALFYTMLYNALPESDRYMTWLGKKVCVLQKEYPTADSLGKPQRQHWDVAVLHAPPESTLSAAKSYDYLKLSAGIEFGLNEAQDHLMDDIERLGHLNSNVLQGFAVHLYRLSARGAIFSGRDWSARSARILTPEKVGLLSIGKTIEIFYGIVDSSEQYQSGLWHIRNGQVIYVPDRC